MYALSHHKKAQMLSLGPFQNLEMCWQINRINSSLAEELLCLEILEPNLLA